jgi:hypothetical protein
LSFPEDRGATLASLLSPVFRDIMVVLFHQGAWHCYKSGLSVLEESIYLHSTEFFGFCF